MARTGRRWQVPLVVLLVLISMPVLAGLALAVRLSFGPIDVTASAQQLIRHAVPGLTLSRVRLAWNPQPKASAPFGLLVDDARLGGIRIGHGSAAFDVASLLRGRATVATLAISDSAVLLYRDREGAISLCPDDVPGGPARPDADGKPAGRRLDLGHLDQLDIKRSVVTLRDVASGLSCHGDIADLVLSPLRRPAATGATGHGAASISCGGSGVNMQAQGWEDPDGGIRWRMTAGPTIPAALAALVPSLAPLAALDLPVTITLEAALSGGFGQYMLPREVHLAARIGAGMIRNPAPPVAGAAAGASAGGSADDAGVAVSGGQVHLTLTLPETPDGTTRAVLSDTSLALAGPAGAPILHLAGSASRVGAHVRASLDAGIARVDFAGLRAYWPGRLAPGARSWVTSNIVAGTGRDLAVSVGLASDSGWNGLRLSRLSGGLDASGLTVFWLRPIPPLQGMDAHLVLEGLDTLRIQSRHATEDMHRAGSQGTITIGPATIRIVGLSRRDQMAEIDGHLVGVLPDLLAVLSHPRLNLLSRHPLPVTDPSGAFDAHLALSVPLLDKVSADDIPVHAEANLTGVHLGRIAAGRDLDGASLAVSADNDGLKLHGRGAISGMPSDLTYSTDFRSGSPSQITETAHVSSQVDEAAVQREGLDAGHRFTGQALLDLGYDRRRDGAANIALALDLTGAGLDTPFWRKSPGATAQASGKFGLLDNRLVSISALHATGPDLRLDAHAELNGGHPSVLVIEQFAVGHSQGVGRIELPAPGTQLPIGVALRGPVLDVMPFLVQSRARAAAKPPDPAPAPADLPWRADLAFRKVLFSAGRAFSGVTLHAEAKGTRLSNASLAIAGPTAITARLVPDKLAPARNGRRLVLDAKDTGALLAALGIAAKVEGGVLRLEGRMEDQGAGSRVTAVARIGPFTVHDAPLAARLARDLSIYGFLAGAPSRQLTVTRFEIPFTLEGDTLRLTDAHASNAALGATLRGPIDLRQERLDLRGTIVPSYLFNALPGKLPGLGKVFSPEKGGGLLAVTLSITGPIHQPAFRINPLALLAPGILRRLLFN